nr:uncharacterized protein LOC128702355 [Cherax quadricarinatus]
MRVKLDLSEFIQDEGKFSMITINVKESKTVWDVLKKICRRFDVSLEPEDADGEVPKKPTVGLFEDEFYIHPDETSTVLQETGVFKLRSLPKKGSSGEGKKKKGKKATHEDVPLSDGEKKERKSKRNKVNEEIQLHDVIKEEKKTKRNRLSEELVPVENEDDDNRKVRKRKRGKTGELEIDVCEVKEYRKHKKTKTSEEKLDSEDDVQTRERGREKKEKLIDKLEEPLKHGEEVRDKKKSKKDKASESQVETEHEVEEVVEKEKKKRKKEKTPSISEEEVIKDNRKKKSRLVEQIAATEKKLDRRKTHRYPIEDDQEITRYYETEKKKKKSQEDKNSQEKVVSTSTVINLESEETSDENFSESSRNYDNQARFSTVSSDQDDHYAADSVTDPQVAQDFSSFDNPVTKKKRKRKHHKGRCVQKKQNEDDDSSVGYILSEEAPLFSTSSDSKHNLPDSRPRNKRPLLNSNFTQRKHIQFTSDDEEEVSSAINEDMESANEIEIVETNTKMSRKKELRSSFPGQSPNHNTMDNIKNVSNLSKSLPNLDDQSSIKSRKEGSLFHSTPDHKKTPDVVEVERESSAPFLPPDYSSLYSISGRSPLNRGKSSNLEQLATLRRIYENKTITVCKVDSRREQTKPKTRELPVSTTGPLFKSPPPVFTSPKQVNDECKQTFQNLIQMKSRTVPLIFPNARTLQRDPSPDVMREKESQSCPPNVGNRGALDNSLSNGSRSAGGRDTAASSLQAISPAKRESCNVTQNYSHEMEENVELHRTPLHSEYESPMTESLPGSSKWFTVPDNTTNQRVGLFHTKRKEKLRPYQSVAACLQNIRQHADSGTEMGELLILNDEVDAICQDEISDEAMLDKEPKAEGMLKSQELRKVTTVNAGVRRNLMSSQVSEKAFKTTPPKSNNEVVDLESDDDEIPTSNGVEMDISAEVLKPNEIVETSNEVIVKNRKTVSFNVKPINNERETDNSTAEIILDKKNRVSSGAKTDDKKKTDCVTEIVEDGPKTVDYIADIEKTGKSTNFGCNFVDDEDEIIEDDVVGFDAEITEDKKETSDYDGSGQDHSEKNCDNPTPAAATSVHQTEDDQRALEEAVFEELKEDMLKEVKQVPRKVSEQGVEMSEAYFEKFPLMKVPPKAGEFIAVKVLSLDKSYAPVYSNYLQARVIKMDGLKVTLKYVDKIKSSEELDKEENVEEVDLTFEEEEEVDLTEDTLDKNAVVEELDWRDICEPRLIFP